MLRLPQLRSVERRKHDQPDHLYNISQYLKKHNTAVRLNARLAEIVSPKSLCCQCSRKREKARIHSRRQPTINSLYALLRTTEIPIYVIAYKENTYMCYCVQWKITSPNADPGPPPAGKIPNPNPRTAAGRPRTAVTAYNGNP